MKLITFTICCLLLEVIHAGEVDESILKFNIIEKTEMLGACDIANVNVAQKNGKYFVAFGLKKSGINIVNQIYRQNKGKKLLVMVDNLFLSILKSSGEQMQTSRAILGFYVDSKNIGVSVVKTVTDKIKMCGGDSI